MLHYADKFKFQHVPFSAPFGSLDYLECLRWCSSKGSRITIIDSMTHEHIGEGGYLETAEAVVDRMAGNDYRKREAVKMLGWAKAGPLRQKMIEGIKQLDGAFIFCFRAKEKTKPVRKTDGKTEIIDMGFMPIAGEEWVYEMALNCMLEPRSDGVPTWRSDHVGERLMMKLPAQFKDIFAESAPLSEDIGRRLAEWAKGGTASSPGPAPSPAVDQAAPAGLSKVAGAAEVPEWQEYVEWWGVILDEAKDARELAGLWNSPTHKGIRREMIWPEIGMIDPDPLDDLTARVTAKINALKKVPA
jgi:hypothetical protein